MKFAGSASDWRVAGDSGNEKIHAFCPTCGTPVYLTFAATPDLIAVHAASLDDPSRFKPAVVTYGIRGLAWDNMDTLCRPSRGCRAANSTRRALPHAAFHRPWKNRSTRLSSLPRTLAQSPGTPPASTSVRATSSAIGQTARCRRLAHSLRYANLRCRERKMYDVVIVGYGPTGMLAAVLLGRAGHRVAVLERHRQLYNLPRVGMVHDDVLRIFQEVGIAERIAPATFFLPTYELANKGRILLSNEVQPNATHGWPEFISIYQPAFEAELDRVARSLPGVSVLQGSKVVDLAQDADSVSVTVEDGEGTRSVHGRFLIGCDGGNSFVRGVLGIDFEFLGFDQDWLVIDARTKQPRPDLPYLRQFCEPEQPGMTMQMGPQHRRWSFMILPGEPHEEAVRPENVWKRLARPEGGTPEEFELIRVVTYKFTSQLAPRWRVGRAFLAGDAAHLMPPFLAQGMCSGFRDAHNLAWKLDLVLQGRAPESLLGSYEVERAPHARATIIESAKVGQNVIERDAEKARERDARLVAMQAELARQRGQKALIAFRVPGLTSGCVARSANARGAGDAFPQGMVRRNGVTGRLDDVAGRGLMLVTRDASLPPAAHEIWRSLGGLTLRLGTGADAIEDVGGVYTRLMHEYDCDVLVKRPDHYLFGACRAADLRAMLVDLRAQLGACVTG